MNTKILHIETATKSCSVAISDGKKLVALVESTDMDYSHAEKLNVFIEMAMKEANVSMQELSAVAVSKGPGSFTGLRIGVASAKGFAYALSIPLIACSTLDCQASGFLSNNSIGTDDLIIPMIDARRREVYMKILDKEQNSLSEIEAKVIDTHSFDDLKKEGRVIHLVGDGAGKFQEEFENVDDLKVHEGLFPSAAFMLPSAFDLFNKNDFEDLAYFEPFYLKDFIAIKARKLF